MARSGHPDRGTGWRCSTSVTHPLTGVTTLWSSPTRHPSSLRYAWTHTSSQASSGWRAGAWTSPYRLGSTASPMGSRSSRGRRIGATCACSTHGSVATGETLRRTRTTWRGWRASFHTRAQTAVPPTCAFLPATPSTACSSHATTAGGPTRAGASTGATTRGSRSTLGGRSMRASSCCSCGRTSRTTPGGSGLA